MEPALELQMQDFLSTSVIRKKGLRLGMRGGGWEGCSEEEALGRGFECEV